MITRKSAVLAGLSLFMTTSGALAAPSRAKPAEKSKPSASPVATAPKAKAESPTPAVLEPAASKSDARPAPELIPVKASSAPAADPDAKPEGCVHKYLCFVPVGEGANADVVDHRDVLWLLDAVLPLGPVFSAMIVMPPGQKPNLTGRYGRTAVLWSIIPYLPFAFATAFAVVGWFPYIGWAAWALVWVCAWAAFAVLKLYVAPVTMAHAVDTAVSTGQATR